MLIDLILFGFAYISLQGVFLTKEQVISGVKETTRNELIFRSSLIGLGFVFLFLWLRLTNVAAWKELVFLIIAAYNAWGMIQAIFNRESRLASLDKANTNLLTSASIVQFVFFSYLFIEHFLIPRLR